MLPLGSVVGLEALQTAQAMRDSVCRWESRVECTFFLGSCQNPSICGWDPLICRVSTSLMFTSKNLGGPSSSLSSLVFLTYLREPLLFYPNPIFISAYITVYTQKPEKFIKVVVCFQHGIFGTFESQSSQSRRKIVINQGLSLPGKGLWVATHIL